MGDAQYGQVTGRNQIIQKNEPARRTRIVCMGGGTGLPTLLKGLVSRADPTLEEPGLDLTAVVAMSDDGGSSGRLRRTRGVLPPGDVRNCLVALTGGKGGMSELFQHRFSGKKGIAGHAVGNLVLAALAELKGDFLQAVDAASTLLQTKGRVLPSTTEPVTLVASMADGQEVQGERNIGRSKQRIRRVSLQPRLPAATPGLLQAIADADLITIGPGSLYTSVLPNLLVDGVAEALRNTRALKVLITNLMTQPGETDAMSCVDHVQAVLEHAGHVVDVVLVNAAPLPADLLRWYSARGGVPVHADRNQLLSLGVIPVEADLIRHNAKRIRHDSRKVARCVVKLARMGL
ncbi:MAG: gluconeogenesis factor YvcK family protein [Myxococcaceae bacterium]